VSKPSVLVAMSGGVDSSVAACLLHEQGYRVLGSHMKLVHLDGVDHGCCGPQAEADAEEVARIGGFDFEIADMSRTFEETVLADFFDEHRAGRTPNPCVRCNEKIKFGAFMERADALGFDFVATGHYVRRIRHDDGTWRIHRGLDANKDQSYVLANLTDRQISRSLFPVGEQTKPETRAHAERFGLPVAGKPDSQEVCFVPGEDHGAFLAEHAPDLIRAGTIIDTAGNELGPHDGTFRFTIGQRRGLKVATGERNYVLETDAVRNRVVVGPQELLSRKGLIAERVGWAATTPDGPLEGEVQIRYKGDAVAAVVTPDPATHGARVDFRTPQRAVTPGQVVAFYSGDELLGGGTIAESF
jgi:tRNA-specific 2-thiouridylase